MAVNVPAYNLNGQPIKELYGTETANQFYYGTGTGSQPSFELIQEDSFNIYFYRKTDTGQLYLMVVFNKYTPSRAGQPGGSISLTISGLSSGYNIEFSDDSAEAFTIVDSNTISNSYAWQRDLTDGFAIELIEPVNTLTIDVTASNNIDNFSFIDNNEELYSIPFSTTTQLTIEPTEITYNGDIYLDPPAGIYQVPKTINVYLSGNVQDTITTNDGTTPTLAEYIAYDNLDPPNPFIAVVQDGKGNVTFDGGFPKIYNTRHSAAWSTFNDLNASFKYVYNVLDFISNDDKVQAGNNKILVLGDANPGDNYNIKETGGSDFNLSLEKLSEISGYEFVYRTREDYADNLDPSYPFLEEHVAVLLFSTRSLTFGNGYLTEQAISNLVAFRENGNGIFIITDHGTGQDGFYVTGNQLASEYGAYFEGTYSRTPVNVGFLRNNYGDHPLYNNLLDSEDIYAGGSESRVFVTEYPTYDSITIPDEDLTNPGYTSYKYLLRDSGDNLQSLSYTYGLQVAEILNFVNDQDQIITTQNIGVDNRAIINFQFNDAGLGIINGLVKRNGIVVGDVFFDGSAQEVQYYRHEGNEIIVDNGDIISVEITSPLQYTKNLQIERFQPNVDDVYSYSRFLSNIDNPTWLDQKVNRNEFSVLENMNYNRSYRRANNITRIRGYVNNTGELPEATALVYSSPIEAQSALETVVEPTQEDIFNQFGIFASAGTSNQQYYETKDLAPNVDPFSTWVYDTNLNSIVQTANTGFYTGFVSPEKLDRYVHEVTVTSPSGDDDLVGVVAAFFRDEVNGLNYTLSFDVTNGGIYNQGVVTAVKNARGLDEKIIATTSHEQTYRNADGGNGWAGKKLRLKIERNQNIIKMIATKWDVLDTYDPASEIVIDLNADPDLSMFIGPQSYGYSSRSQPNSTFENISFTGGVNYDFVVDMQQQTVFRYNVVTLEWESTGITIQDLYGYPRTVRNPNTGETFDITETNVSVPYWGNENTIKVTGPRYVDGGNNTYQIANYNGTKTYSITSSKGTITNNGSTFILSGLSTTDNQVSINVSDGSDSTTVNVVREFVVSLTYFNGSTYEPITNTLTMADPSGIDIRIENYDPTYTFNVSSTIPDLSFSQTGDIITVTAPSDNSQQLSGTVTVSTPFSSQTFDIIVEVFLVPWDLTYFNGSTYEPITGTLTMTDPSGIDIRIEDNDPSYTFNFSSTIPEVSFSQTGDIITVTAPSDNTQQLSGTVTVSTESLSQTFDIIVESFAPPTAPWDLSAYSGKPMSSGNIFDATSEESQGIKFLSFKSDGTKMYLGSSAYGTVFQYTLGTPWNVSTATYDNVSYDQRTQDDDIYGGYIKSDGTEMFLVGRTGSFTINKYSLSTTWDVSSSSFVSSYVPSEVSFCTGIYFKPDGSKMYLLDGQSGASQLYQYSLSTPWNISTSVYDSITHDISNDLGGGTIYGLAFEDTGNRFYIGASDRIYQFEIGTSWDLSTASYDVYAYETVSPTGFDPIQSIAFKPDGLSVFVGTANDDEVHEHVLAGAWDFGIYENLSDIPAAANLATSAQVVSPYSMDISSDGMYFFVSGIGDTVVARYDATTAWDLSTAFYSGDEFDVSTEITIAWDIRFKPDGTKMYILNGGDDSVHQYSLTTPWDLNTASFENKEFDFDTVIADRPFGMDFKPDGTVMYVTFVENDIIQQYNLTTPWDITTATLDRTADFDRLVRNPTAIEFKPDGTKLFVRASDVIYQFEVQTPWEIFSLRYENIKYYDTSTNATYGLRFRADNGESMYWVNKDLQRMFQYDIV